MTREELKQMYKDWAKGKIDKEEYTEACFLEGLSDNEIDELEKEANKEF